jgi:hypothetical protein
MRAPIAYFAGAGTVIAAIGLGLGGGLTIANVMNPHQDKLEQTKLEQRMAAKPIPPSAEADQAKIQAANTATDKPQAEQGKAPLPNVAATNAAAISTNTPAAQSEPPPPKQAAAPAPQSSPQPDEAKVANDQPAKPAEPQIARAPAAPPEQASSDNSNAKARSPEDANATARDSDLKRLAAEKRKAQRRQQWADRKKALQQRDAEQRDVEANARRDSDDRPLIRNFDGPRIVRDSRDSDAPRIRDNRNSDGRRLVVRQDDDDFNRRGDHGDSGRRGNFDRPFGFPGFNLFGGGDRDD